MGETPSASIAVPSPFSQAVPSAGNTLSDPLSPADLYSLFGSQLSCHPTKSSC